MRLIAASEVRGTAAVSDKQLKAALLELLPQPPRRIDRLIYQALLAAAPLRDSLRGRCGLYLAARHPARPTMGALLDAVCVQQRQPKPFEFVNSVSNAAGFHVAQQLGLDGPNLFIGAGPGVWRQLQLLAGVDLASARIDQALLLLIDENGDFCAQGALLEGHPEQPPAASFEQLCSGQLLHRRQLQVP